MRLKYLRVFSGTCDFLNQVIPSFLRFGVKDYNAFQESKSMGEATWDAAQYCEDNGQMCDGAYPFDIWLPIALGGTGELHITGLITIGQVVHQRSRKGSVSSLTAGDFFKRPLSIMTMSSRKALD